MESQAQPLTLDPQFVDTIVLGLSNSANPGKEIRQQAEESIKAAQK